MNNVIQISRPDIDKLLSNETQQTTIPKTYRFKVGDVAHIYNQQRRRIVDKPELPLTRAGIRIMDQRYDPNARQELLGIFYAHFLGKVEITKVYLFYPVEMATFELQNWAQADGFKNFHPTRQIFTKGVHDDDGANMWFQRRYGDNWMHQTWTVIQWDGWLERYFLANGEQQ